MSTNPYDEKGDEKRYEKDEKDQQKHEEKTIDEKYRRDPLGTSTWALILIFAGLVFTANNLGLLESTIRRFLPTAYSDLQYNIWAIILLGAGLILILQAIIRMALPSYRAHVGGSLVMAAVMIGLAIGTTFNNWAIIGPLILIAIGVSILIRGLVRLR